MIEDLLKLSRLSSQPLSRKRRPRKLFARRCKICALSRPGAPSKSRLRLPPCRRPRAAQHVFVNLLACAQVQP